MGNRTGAFLAYTRSDKEHTVYAIDYDKFVDLY